MVDRPILSLLECSFFIENLPSLQLIWQVVLGLHGRSSEVSLA